MTNYPPQSYPPVPAKRRPIWPWVLLTIASLALAGCFIGVFAVGGTKPKPSGGPSSAQNKELSNPDPDFDAAETASPQPDPEVFEAGTYEVGKKSDPVAGTIKPGTYVLLTDSHCYWERVRGFSGDFNDIIANDNLDATGDKAAQARVTVKRSDKGLTLNGSCILGQKGGLK